MKRKYILIILVTACLAFYGYYNYLAFQIYNYYQYNPDHGLSMTNYYTIQTLKAKYLLSIPHFLVLGKKFIVTGNEDETTFEVSSAPVDYDLTQDLKADNTITEDGWQENSSNDNNTNVTSGECYKLMDNNGFNKGNYSVFPITDELKPRVPVTINMTFTIDDLSSSSMLFRYGDYGIAAQIGITEGVVGGDFREGIVGDRNGGAKRILGNRSLTGRIGLGYHTLKMRYNGRTAELWIDGKLVDSINEQIDITKFDGNIWVGRNGYAYYPFYFKGKIHEVELCF